MDNFGPELSYEGAAKIGTDFWMGVAATLPELSELTLSVNSKPDHPRRFARSYCPGGRVFTQFSLPGGEVLNSRNFLQF